MAEKYRTSDTDYYPSFLKTELLPFNDFLKQNYYLSQCSANRLITLYRDRARGRVFARRFGNLVL
jgi:hypothetical protein